MTVDELEQVTASASAGEAGKKQFFKVLRGNSGKFGVQLIIDLTVLDDAVKAGAYTFVGKDGHNNLCLNPKVWPKKEGKFVNREAKKPEPQEQYLDDEVPF